MIRNNVFKLNYVVRRLTTVPSLDAAIATGQYITHTGACGTCSSLQDLALMVDYPNLPYKAQQCFFRSNALADIEGAITCYEEIGFTSSCSKAFAYHQKIIVDRECGYQCAAWGFDGDLGRRKFEFRFVLYFCSSVPFCCLIIVV